MSRKDYILIANALLYAYNEECKTNDEHGFFVSVVNTMADFLSEDNPKFNKQKFIDYIMEMI